jgi:hypothetical protein
MPGPSLTGTRARATPDDEIRRFFAADGRHVIVFAGFGELGYEDDGIVERVARQVLAPWDRDRALVASGTLLRAGGQDGIAAVFAAAKALGFATAGIHPSVALEHARTHRPSPFCDHVFYVGDRTWGGFVAGSREPSPTLRLVLDVAGELVVIGGGKHAADELAAFLSHGRRVRYFEAEMNRRATDDWCRRAGARIEDYRGAAHRVWEASVNGLPGSEPPASRPPETVRMAGADRAG